MTRMIYGKSSIHGKGIFAGEDIPRGKRIAYINGKKEKKVTHNKEDSESIANWIGLGKDFWINTKGTPFRYINHSCDPNAAITGTKTVVALVDIREGDEITIDYSMTDADPHWQIDCRCGSKNCRKRIRAIYTVPEDVFLRHLPYVPRYFKRLYLRTCATTLQPAASGIDKKHRKS